LAGAARAQQAAVPAIGFLNAASLREYSVYVAGFIEASGKLDLSRPY
jgi:hypothetical protein